jgi:hypothetical protein
LVTSVITENNAMVFGVIVRIFLRVFSTGGTFA